VANLELEKPQGRVWLEAHGSLVRSIPPPIGLRKINVDVALAKNSGVVTIAVVTRDAMGKFQGASAMVIQGLLEPNTVEAIACKRLLVIRSSEILDYRVTMQKLSGASGKGPWALMDILFRKLELDHAISILLILFMKEGNKILMPTS
jgi:hypothetical protein